jgi:CBS domain-containing protein
MEFLDVIQKIKQIANAGSLEELVLLRHQLHQNFLHHLSFDVYSILHDLINDMHEELIKRAVQLAENNMMLTTGMQLKPFAFVLLGSGGRREQTLWSDQDHAIIYDTKESQHESFYQALAEKIQQNLIQVGYPLCEGNVLCTNHIWRGDIEKWMNTIDKWFASPHWEHVRYMLIFADSRCVYGNHQLLQKIKDHFINNIKKDPNHLLHMVQNTLYRKVSLGILGQLIKVPNGVNQGGIDIKYGVYIPMINSIRLFALSQGILQISSEERIQQLLFLQVISPVQAERWQIVLIHVLFFRSISAYSLTDNQFITQGIITVVNLTPKRKKQIKQCIRVGRDLQKAVTKMINKKFSL